MTQATVDTGQLSMKLATAVREVNARHLEAGRPDLPELRWAWLRLDYELDLARTAGDGAAALRAVGTYRRTALAMIEEASG